MNLSNRQKKLIKKHYKQSSLEQLAEYTGLEISQVSYYLKKQLGEDKFRQMFQKESFSKQSDPARSSIKELLYQHRNVLLLLTALVFFVYVNSLGNEFVSDDLPSIVNNPKLASLGNINSLRDLGSLPFFILYQIKMVPWLFRGLNIMFHLGSAFLLFLVISVQIRKTTVAMIAATLFAIHPLLTEGVSWISAMPYTQYTFFFLFSFLCYLLFRNTRSKKYLAYAALFYTGALLTTDKATVLFLLFPLYELSIGSLKQYWKYVMIFIVLGCLFLIYYLTGLDQRTADLQGTYYQESGLDNPFIQIPTAIASYLTLIFWPLRLSFYHTELSLSPGIFTLYVLLFLGYLAAVIFAYMKNRVLFFWLSFFFITLIPTLTPLRISWVVAERYVYLGSMGMFVTLAYLYTKLLEREKLKKPLYVCGITVLLLLSIRTIIRNTDWKNHDSLWIATAKTAPSGHVIHNNLGDMHARHGDINKAIEEFKKAIEINPRYADAYHNLANTYQSIKQYDQAIENYQKAQELNPGLWQSHQNLAAIYYKKQDYTKAKESLAKAIEINPQDETLREQLRVIEELLTR